ncbi:hypothetical protein ANN_11444 [Periplaneta americana]|uniref:Uncharacterized protein n=1 Tax=Periplaneta americana TaxID=6978 RepID=A0ABQ8T6J6_PERAM|nr:hypothetical protein ANN_11444 [Periplaneta americana]
MMEESAGRSKIRMEMMMGDNNALNSGPNHLEAINSQPDLSGIQNEFAEMSIVMGKEFSHEILTSVCDQSPSSIVINLGNYDRKGELLRNNRHHWVKSLIAECLKKSGKFDVYEELPCISPAGSTKRADIIAIDNNQKSGFIIDPNIRFEGAELQPQEIDLEKKRHYEPCFTYLEEKYHIPICRWSTIPRGRGIHAIEELTFWDRYMDKWGSGPVHQDVIPRRADSSPGEYVHYPCLVCDSKNYHSSKGQWLVRPTK